MSWWFGRFPTISSTSMFRIPLELNHPLSMTSKKLEFRITPRVPVIFIPYLRVKGLPYGHLTFQLCLPKSAITLYRL